MMSHVKMYSSTTFHILLVKVPIELYTLKLTMGFQQQLAHLSPRVYIGEVNMDPTIISPNIM